MSVKTNISADTNLLCLIGHPISHSYSPLMHNLWINDLKLPYVYLAFEILPPKLEKAVVGFKGLNIKGINVTIPFKESIIPYLDKVEGVANSIKAINTIKNEQGNLIARNTDAEGAKKALIEAGCKIAGKRIIILGAGGAAKAICFAIAEDADSLIIANRTEKRAKNLVSNIISQTDGQIESIQLKKQVLEPEIRKADILINTTPVGMSPDVNEVPISTDLLHNNLFVFDLIYNPLETKLLKNAAEIGCKTLGGLDMLIYQGALAFEWWTGKKPNMKYVKTKMIELSTKNNVR